MVLVHQGWGARPVSNCPLLPSSLLPPHFLLHLPLLPPPHCLTSLLFTHHQDENSECCIHSACNVVRILLGEGRRVLFKQETPRACTSRVHHTLVYLWSHELAKSLSKNESQLKGDVVTWDWSILYEPLVCCIGVHTWYSNPFPCFLLPLISQIAHLRCLRKWQLLGCSSCSLQKFPSISPHGVAATKQGWCLFCSTLPEM